jgi:DNA-binding LacI/PurR family transcriptional regulator
LTSPELGYPVIKQLLAHHRSFTALLSFNDIAALGAFAHSMMPSYGFLGMCL